MRRTLFLLAVLAPAAALVGLLWESGWAPFGSSPTLARRPNQSVPAGPPASRPSVISIADGSGSDLFMQRDDEAMIGGRPLKYARSFAFARAWANAGSGIVLAEQPIVIFNTPPRTEHDVERLLSIGTASGPKQAGREIDAAFGSRTGIRSDEARIQGTSDFSRLSRVEFTGHVRAIFVDPEVPDDRVHLATESLVLDFEENVLVAIRTDDTFTITRPRARDLTFAARGLEVLLTQGRAKILHDVRIDVVPPERFSAVRAPITLTTPGSIDIEFGKASDGRPGSFSLAGSRVVAAGGVSFAEGDLRGAARQGTVIFDQASQITSVELLGDVRISAPEGEVHGSRLVATPGDEPVLLEIHGHPIVVRPGRSRSLFPAQLGEDVELTTPGRIRISPIRLAPDGSEERTIEIGQDVVIAGTTGRLDARTMAIRIGSPDPNGERPFRVTFEKVASKDAEMEFRGDSATVVRAGVPGALDDVITVPGAYEMVHRGKAAPADSKATTGATPAVGKNLPAFGNGPLRIEGSGGLTITRPVLDDRPLTAVIREKFQIIALDPDGGTPRATLQAARGSLTADFSGASARPGGAPSRSVATFVAEGRVRIELPGRASARGERLTYDARTQRIVLAGMEGAAAHVERVVGQARDQLAAGSLTFHIDLLRLVATGSVDAELALIELPWIGTARSTEKVASQVRAQRLVASLDADRFAAGEVVATEVVVEIAVKVLQPGRTLSADSARFDPIHLSGILRGSPLKYDVVRDVDGVSLAEGLVCPAIVMEGQKILIEGPAVASLHAKPGFSGTLTALGDAPTTAASRPKAGTQEPVRLRCGGRALMTEEFVRADGRAVMEQGHPGAAGMRASADSVTLFLEKDPALPRADPDFALAVLSGNASVTSVDFEAASDIMKLNRVTRHATLLNERPEKVTVILRREVKGSDVYNGVSRLDIDFTDPANPKVTAFDHDVTLGPDTRSGRP